MESVLKLVDAYDLYGSVAYPKRHSQSDISDIYHLAAATRGVFVNVALQVRTARIGGRVGADFRVGDGVDGTRHGCPPRFRGLFKPPFRL